MRRTRRILSILLWLLAVAPAAHAQPVATWLDTEHNFGVFHELDGPQSCRMRVVNTGDSALLLLAARTNCGCTASDYPREPIAPGDTAVVTLTYQPLHRPGRFEKLATITTNARPTAKTTLTIRGLVLASEQTLANNYPNAAGSLRLSTTDVAIGTLTRRGHRMGHLTAYNPTTDTLLVTLTDTPAHVKPRAIPDTVPPGDITVVTVFYDAAQAPLWGFNANRFTLLCTPLHPDAATREARSGHATIEVMANVNDDFSTLTDEQRQHAPHADISCGERLDFGCVERGSEQKRTFTLTNTGATPLEVRRLWSPDTGISATAEAGTIAPKHAADITVTVAPQATDSDMLNATLTIITNDPDSPERTLRLVGETRQQPTQ